MNPNNYASIEASRRLVEAGIVLETEAVWVRHGLSKKWNVELSSDYLLRDEYECIPAPSMAEVWRELKKELTSEKSIVYTIQEMDEWTAMGSDVSLLVADVCTDINKSIDLLIWVRKEAKHE